MKARSSHRHASHVTCCHLQGPPPTNRGRPEETPRRGESRESRESGEMFTYYAAALHVLLCLTVVQQNTDGHLFYHPSWRQLNYKPIIVNVLFSNFNVHNDHHDYICSHLFCWIIFYNSYKKERCIMTAPCWLPLSHFKCER